MAGLIRGVQDLVVEDGEVQGESKTDGVGRRKLGLSNLGGSLVSLERLVGGILPLVANGELGEVAVVVSLPVRLSVPWPHHCSRYRIYAHLVVEHLGLAGLGGRDEVLIKDHQDILADLGELRLDLLAVLLDKANLGRVALGLLLLLNRGHDAPRCTASADDVLVGDGQKVTLLHSEVAVFRGDNLHVVDHL